MLRPIAIQAIAGAVLFTIISVVLEGSHGKEIWLEKGIKGLLFGAIYGIFLIVKDKFKK